MGKLNNMLQLQIRREVYLVGEMLARIQEDKNEISLSQEGLNSEGESMK